MENRRFEQQLKKYGDKPHQLIEEYLPTKQVLNKYDSIYPLLAIVNLRLQYSKRFDDQTSAIFAQDGYFPELPNFISGIKMAVATVLKSCVYFLKRKEAIKKDVILLSNTFVYSKRYVDTLTQIKGTYNVAKINSIYDVKLPNETNQKKYSGYFKGDVSLNLHGMNFAGGVAGWKLKWKINKWHKFIFELLNTGKTCDDFPKKTECLLKDIQNEYVKVNAKISRALLDFDVKSYITTNQYNLRDVLIITACHNLGIKTKQLEHHAMQFSRSSFSETNKMSRYIFTDDICCWYKSEVDFHNRVFNLVSCFDKETNMYFVGNPEIKYEQALYYNQVIKPRKLITLMTAWDIDLSDEEKEIETKWLLLIISKLSDLAKKQNGCLRVRFNPDREVGMRTKEIEIIKKNGVEVSSSVPESLMEDFFSSVAIFSTCSSVLGTAVLIGRKAYRIEDRIIKYIKVDEKIIDVTLDEIENIVLPEVSEIDELNKDDFLDLEKLFAY